MSAITKFFLSTAVAASREIRYVVVLWGFFVLSIFLVCSFFFNPLIISEFLV